VGAVKSSHNSALPPGALELAHWQLLLGWGALWRNPRRMAPRLVFSVLLLLNLSLLIGKQLRLFRFLTQLRLDSVAELSFVVLTVLVVAGLLGPSFIETRRLRQYPLRGRLLFTALIISGPLQWEALIIMIIIVPWVLAVLWPLVSSPWTAFIVVGGMLLIWWQALAARELLWELIRQIVHARRSRLLIVIATALGIALLTLMAEEFIRSLQTSNGDWRALLAADYSRYLPFLPSKMLSALLVDLGKGRLVGAASQLSGLIAWTVGLWWVGGWAFARSLHQPAANDGARRVRRYRGELWLSPPLPLSVAAIIAKEAHYLRRDPITLSVWAVAQLPVLLFLAVGIIIRKAAGPNYLSPSAEAGILYAAGLVTAAWLSSSIGQNLFGMERKGLIVLLNAPVENRLLVLGKNLFLGGVIMLEITFLLGGLALLLATSQGLLTAWLTSVGLLTAYIGIANLISVYFPYEIEQLGDWRYAPVEGGLLGFIAIVITTAPVLLSLFTVGRLAGTLAAFAIAVLVYGLIWLKLPIMIERHKEELL